MKLDTDGKILWQKGASGYAKNANPNVSGINIMNFNTAEDVLLLTYDLDRTTYYYYITTAAGTTYQQFYSSPYNLGLITNSVFSTGSNAMVFVD